MERKLQPPKSLRRDATAALAVCTGYHARLAARRVTQFLEQRIAGTGLSLAQMGLMALVASAEDDTLGALAERAGVDQSTLSRNLRGLESAGLVEIAGVEGDLRRRAVWLTEAGARRLEAALALWRPAHAELARLIDPALARRLAKASEALIAK